ncbi:hypothetical protein ABKA04_003319 [Annulohypoxylon sp. FPYF3050]
MPRRDHEYFEYLDHRNDEWLESLGMSADDHLTDKDEFYDWIVSQGEGQKQDGEQQQQEEAEKKQENQQQKKEHEQQ